MSLLHLSGGGSEEKLDVSDVFSTYLYTGNGSTQTINNGIDLAGKGGMVWTKSRVTSYPHELIDTERGVKYSLRSNGSDAYTNPLGSNAGFSSFNNNGYSIAGAFGNWGSLNANNEPHVSWTFRKAPKFFDVVTYTGNGTSQTINHSLGAAPGVIIVKKTSGSQDWAVWHRTFANTENIALNSTGVKQTGVTAWNSTTPTSSSFSVGASNDTNQSGATYVAYLFAHDPSADGIIQCGITDASGNATLGWEPQYVLVKQPNNVGGWVLLDTMRGWINGSTDSYLFANASDAEASNGGLGNPTATGFTLGGGPYIYMAIARSMKEPTSSSEVFAIDTHGSTADGKAPAFRSNFVVDASLYRYGNDLVNSTHMLARLTGVNYLKTSDASAGPIENDHTFDYMNGFNKRTDTQSNRYAWMFKRAKGFFDVVCYTGNGVAGRTVNHNLGAVPEMIWVKKRNTTHDWWVLDYTNNGALQLNQNYVVNTPMPTNLTTGADLESFILGNYTGVNNTGDTYIAYLFATLAGISKVGSYTGNGTTQTIDAGFTTGAKFIIIKRTDSTGDWYMWDTVRGIVAANDPHLSLNTTAAEVTTDDSVDPATVGFIVNQNTATNINVNAGSYIYYSIANPL